MDKFCVGDIVALDLSEILTLAADEPVFEDWFVKSVRTLDQRGHTFTEAEIVSVDEDDDYLPYNISVNGHTQWVPAEVIKELVKSKLKFKVSDVVKLDLQEVNNPSVLSFFGESVQKAVSDAIIYEGRDYLPVVILDATPEDNLYFVYIQFNVDFWVKDWVSENCLSSFL